MHELLDELTAEELASHEAVAIIDGDDEMRAARLQETIWNGLMYAVSRISGSTIDAKDFRDLEDFIPKFRFERKREEKPIDYAALENQLKSLAGIK